MNDIILHHFDASPFAEKIRIILGIKKLTWQSVQIPMIMPKPDLTELTGGYRKTPVLQIGADIYCDTWLIADVLDQRCPQPAVFRNGERGRALALSRWSDKSFFEPGAALSMGENPAVPDAVIDDRKAFFNFMDFGKLAEALPESRRRFQAHAALIEADLESTSNFLDGDTPGFSDVLAWFVVWMAYGNIPSVEQLLEPFPALRNWANRMRVIGHGEVSNLDAGAAIEIAAAATPVGSGSVAKGNPLELESGQAVAVFADDYGQDRVTGALVHLDHARISIQRTADRAGDLQVHFPAIGYAIEALG